MGWIFLCKQQRIWYTCRDRWMDGEIERRYDTSYLVYYQSMWMHGIFFLYTFDIGRHKFYTKKLWNFLVFLWFIWVQKVTRMLFSPFPSRFFEAFGSRGIFIYEQLWWWISGDMNFWNVRSIFNWALKYIYSFSCLWGHWGVSEGFLSASIDLNILR